MTQFEIPRPEDYDVSSKNGFLPTHAPIESLPEYYEPWEYIGRNLQGLILSKRLHEVVDKCPILETEHLVDNAQWRRAYSLLGFIVHSYVWGGVRPMQRIPPSLSIPFQATCKHLELPPVATYAGLCLWNWRPIFANEPVDTLANLDMQLTFTGSLDEKWFYLISVALEAQGGSTVPLMLNAIESARRGNRDEVLASLQTFAERIDEVIRTLSRMYENCDPHVFYHRIRPYLAGGKNMQAAGLPNGIIFDNGGPINKQEYTQCSGGSNAQSSIIQFFDIVLGIEHRPTGTKKDAAANGPTRGPPPTNFIHEMRKYMPGPHARFLHRVADVANIREFVQNRPGDRELSLAFDACIAMISALRDTHIRIVTRYIVIKSREVSREEQGSVENGVKKLNLASKQANADNSEKSLRGTGGSSLIPFLRQARDESGEPAIDAWTRRYLVQRRGGPKADAQADAELDIHVARSKALAAQWENSNGGLCHC